MSFDRELVGIVGNSLVFSLTSTVLTSFAAIPSGVWLAFHRGALNRMIVAVLSTLMAVPTVVVGLVVYSLTSQSGLLGPLGLLFTPGAIILGQTILAYPLVTALVYGSIRDLEPELAETLRTFGSGPWATVWKTLSESRVAIVSAVLSGFGRLLGEVGVSMMLGGNIRYYTRTMTTALALETQRGAFSLALALGMVLLALAFGVNFALHWMAHRVH